MFLSESSFLSMLSANGPHCFLPETWLQALHGLRRVEELRADDVVLAADGTELTIRTVKKHQSKPQPLVALRAEEVFSTFTESHRVNVQHRNEQLPVKAGTLREGDDVRV